MKSVILFDGVCNLCNGAVNFIIDRDPQGRFQFAALQSSIGQNMLRPIKLDENSLKTIILIEDGQVYKKSTAIIKIARHLIFPWPLFYLFIIVPPLLRNACYDFVAKNRYRWFGKKDHCRVPTPELQKRFI